MKIKLYIEGGGDSALQDTLFREGWQVFFQKAGKRWNPRFRGQSTGLGLAQSQAVPVGGGEGGGGRVVPGDFQGVEASAELGGVGEGFELAQQGGIRVSFHA